MQSGMKIRHIVFTLLPALAVADEVATVPDDEPLLPPLPEELLSPQKGEAGLPASARPVVSYRAPGDEEQTWLKLFYIKPTDEWPDIFRRMAAASHEKDMQMCHGYALWLKGQNLVHLRYDDDLSLSGIHADGHAYGVLYVEFSPYGIRVAPMAGFDLTGKNGGVCWQDAAGRLWSWAEAEAFWAELPKLLKADTKTRATSAHDSAVKRDVATKGQRMVVFWAPAGYPARAWWSSFLRLHTQAGANRFSLVAADGLKLWGDVVVPNVTPAPAPAPPQPVASPPQGTAPSPPTPVTVAPPPAAVKAVTPPPPPAPAPPAPAVEPVPQPAPPAAPSPASAPQTGGSRLPVAPAATAAKPAVPDTLHPATGSPRDVAPDASVRPWALEDGIAPSPSKSGKKKASAAPAPAPALAPATPASPAAATPPAAPGAPVAAEQPPQQPRPASRALDALDAIALP